MRRVLLALVPVICCALPAFAAPVELAVDRVVASMGMKITNVGEQTVAIRGAKLNSRDECALFPGRGASDYSASLMPEQWLNHSTVEPQPDVVIKVGESMSVWFEETPCAFDQLIRIVFDTDAGDIRIDLR